MPSTSPAASRLGQTEVGNCKCHIECKNLNCFMAWDWSPNESCARHLSGLCTGWTGTGLFGWWNMESERDNCNHNNNNKSPKEKHEEKKMQMHRWPGTALEQSPEIGPLCGELFGWKDWSCKQGDDL